MKLKQGKEDVMMSKSAVLVVCGAVLIFVALLIACKKGKPSFFQTKFHNKAVENSIHQFPYWQEIQGEEVDKAFEVYMKYAQQMFPIEAVGVSRILERGGMLGVAIEAHEKWEVLEYLKKGYLLEEIGNGKAYKEHKKSVAHAEARFKELKLYQFWYRQLLNENPPAMKAFLFVNPFLKYIAQDCYHVEVDIKLMRMLVDELKGHRNTVMSEDCFEADIEKCVTFFEKTGWGYEGQRDFFLDKGLLFLREIK